MVIEFGGGNVGHETVEPFGCGFSNKNVHAWKAENNIPILHQPALKDHMLLLLKNHPHQYEEQKEGGIHVPSSNIICHHTHIYHPLS
jgi:hypothetical protein